MQKKQLPIGISDYKELIDKNCYYVDKTLLIKDIIEGGKIILITRPRRFGKTLNQSMMRYFFEKTEADNSYLFKDKKIWRDDDFQDMQGKYPVIYLSFKDIKSNNHHQSYENIKFLLSKEYKRHKAVLQNIEENKEKEIYQKIIDREASLTDYKFSLLNLSEYLYNHYDVKPILLIDEYDTPIIAAYNNQYYDDFINFYKVFLGAALKDNEFLEKSVLTGITKVAKESIFSDINNLDVSTVLSKFFNDKFGLLEEEVLEILDYYNLEYETDKVIDWYNGYNMGGQKVYNPFSIINFTHKNEFKEYWINSSGNVLIKDLIRKSTADFKNGVFNLIKGKEIESTIKENLVFSDIDGSEENIWTLLLFSGYLKWTEHKDHRKYKLQVPNKEVMYFYNYTVDKILKDKNIELINMVRLLLNEEIEDFKDEFKILTRETLSYFDTKEKNPEKFYHGLILGMLVGLKDSYIIKSNRESGYGRVDVLLLPKNKEDKGLIFEFKKFSQTKDKNLNNSALKALKQIDEKGYEARIKSHGVNEIIKVGIAFKGKQVEIASNIEPKEKRLSETEKIARGMLRKGMNFDLISELTGLQGDEIRNLKE